jgi:glycosyltransferase involved in cell wall biosynthesis
MHTRFVVNLHPAFRSSDFEEAGVGGSEASLILFSRELARRGHTVEVFNLAENEGRFRGVCYRNLRRFRAEDECDLLVVFRAAIPSLAQVRARHVVYWSTDIQVADWDQTIFPFVDHVFCMSEFHLDFMAANYIRLPQERTTVLGLGIHALDYELDQSEPPRKTGNRLIYCSVPDRGLVHLRRLFPRIRASIPDAELLVTSDFTLWGRASVQSGVEEHFKGIEGLSVLGNVPRARLVELQKSAKIMAYPCTYTEGFCISAAECMAAGAVPVTTNGFALSTTVGNAGVLVDGRPGDRDYDEAFVAAVVDLLQNDLKRERLVSIGRQRAANEFTWRTIADRFERVVALIPIRSEPLVVRQGEGTRRPVGDKSIAIIIPVHGQAQYLSRALASVVWQMRPEDELIVINDASPDLFTQAATRTGEWNASHMHGVPEISAAALKRVLWLHNTDRSGVSASRNRGILRARTEWIKFLDADDVLAPYALDLLRNQSLSEDVKVVAGGCHRIVNGKYADYLCDTEASLHHILERIPILPSAAFVRRQTLIDVGLFDEAMDLEEDWDLWLRIHERFGLEAFAVTTAPVCYYWINSTERASKERTGTRNGQPVREYFRERYGVTAS